MKKFYIAIAFVHLIFLCNCNKGIDITTKEHNYIDYAYTQKELDKILYLGMPQDQVIVKFGNPSMISSDGVYCDYDYLTTTSCKEEVGVVGFTVNFKDRKVIRWGLIGSLKLRQLANDKSKKINKYNIKPVKLAFMLVKDYSDKDKRVLDLDDKTLIANDDVADAKSFSTGYGRCVIYIHMKRNSINKLRKITKQNMGKRIAILLDDKIMSTPVIKEPIKSGVVYLSLPQEITKKQAVSLAKGILTGVKTVPVQDNIKP